MRRGFTLVEVAIVLAIMNILVVPMLGYVYHLKLESANLREISDLRTEARATAEKIFQHAASGFKIQADNASLVFKDGARVFWKDNELYLDEQKLTSHKVPSFVAIRRNKTLTLNITLERKTSRPGRDPVQYRNIYDYEVAP